MADPQNRTTQPGFLSKAYEKAKAALGGFAAKGRQASQKAGTGDTGASQRPHAGDDWKNKPAEPVSQADKVRAQDEMKSSLGGKDDASSREAGAQGTEAKTAPISPGEPGSGDAQKRRGEVELESPYTTRPQGGEENPAAPGAGDVDRSAIDDRQRHEEGEVPSEGLGLDDGPRVKYPSDTGQ